MLNGTSRMFCSTGHLTECLVGMTCEEAKCAHYDQESDENDLGTCCICGKSGKTVRNIIVLDRETAPENYGKGWGCLVCGLPMNGASAVLCDDCVPNRSKVDKMVIGWPKENRRRLLSEVPYVEFKHDELKHMVDEGYIQQ